MVRMPYMLAKTLGPSFKEGYKRTPVTGLAATASTSEGWYALSREANCAPQYGLQNRLLWPSPETLAIDRFVHGGCRKQNSPEQHLWRTPPAEWERRKCLTPYSQEQFRWWNLGSSQRPTDEKINQWNGINSSRRCRLLRVKSWLMSSGAVKESC